VRAIMRNHRTAGSIPLTVPGATKRVQSHSSRMRNKLGGRFGSVAWVGVLVVTMLHATARAELWDYTTIRDNSSNTFLPYAQEHVALGYRTISLSSATNQISAVWLQDYVPAELQLFVPYADVSSNTMAMRAKGFRPVNVAVFGEVPNESYLISYVGDGKAAALFTRLTTAELTDLGSGTPGARIAWLEVCPAGENAGYAAILTQDGRGGCLEVGLEKPAMESRIASYGEAGYRPVCVVGVADTSGLVYTANWVEETRRWTNGIALSAAQTGSFLRALKPRQFRPEIITQYLADDRQTVLYSVVAVEDLPAVWTMTGNAVPGLEGFDRAMTNAMHLSSCTRASFALSKNGRLVVSRAYTHHPLSIAPTQPTNSFRLASISKSITAVATIGLVEARRLRLDDPIGRYLDLSDVLDQRWTNITVRHLLQHRGGWNRNTTFDPMFYEPTISAALGVPLPVTKDQIFTYMKTHQRLQADPGSVYSYSNFGYMLLGGIIEVVAGLDYESFVRQNVMAPIGIYSARLARSTRAGKRPGEVEYEEGTTTYPSVLSPDRPPATAPYGLCNLENADSAGGWGMSAEDLVRFGSMFFEKTNSPLLSADSIEEMWKPAPQEQLPVTGWYTVYGCGWVLQGLDQGPVACVFHDGGLPGTCTLLVRLAEGYCYAVLFNTRNDAGTDPIAALNGGTDIEDAVHAIAAWPTNDLFDSDGDRLPDSYELARFGSLSASDGTLDQDLDGLSDEAEWIALSDPLDALDAPQLGIRAGVDGTPVLEIASHGGRVYSVHSTAAPGLTWDDPTEILSFNGDGYTRALALTETSSDGFYRLGVALRAKPRSPGMMSSGTEPTPGPATAAATRVGLRPRRPTGLTPRVDLPRLEPTTQ
jgi:CubicO group peptidase (beta-lactamase class C family)